MDDEQIARAFVREVRKLCNIGVATSTLVAIIGEARTTERARCAAIALSYNDDAYQDSAQYVAREILRAILSG